MANKKNPRVHVTLPKEEYEMLCLEAKKKHMSVSSILRMLAIVHVEEEEDKWLAIKAEAAEERWIAGGRKTYTHEEVCKSFGIKSNIPKNR